ncbi:hypothetical protein BC831DRAFT_440209 [Entophlyctis helioformis]|nr:hypothetical protein BC831DRAFT_440209 [Entophlyctis helioformis]
MERSLSTKPRWRMELLAMGASLLSSSCCVIQLVMNYLSLGCAGFAVLTPYRPHFTALAVLLLSMSVVAGGWSRRTVATAAVCGLLMVSQDVVAAHNDGRLDAVWRDASARIGGMADMAALVSGIQRRVNPQDSDTSKSLHMQQVQQQLDECRSMVQVQTFSFHVHGIKCEGCAARLKDAIARHPGVYDVQVLFADKSAVVTRRQPATAASITDDSEDRFARAIMQTIAQVDFAYTTQLIRVDSREEIGGCED